MIFRLRVIRGKKPPISTSSMRLSKRLRGEAPTPVANLIAEAIASNPTKRALRASLTSGGRSGRLKKTPESEWTFSSNAPSTEDDSETPDRNQRVYPCTDKN